MTATSQKTTVEILNEAADIIERDGWVSRMRHEFGTSRVCAIGALERAATGISYARYIRDSYLGESAEKSCPAAMAALADMVRARFPERPATVHQGTTIASWSNSHTEADGAKKVACLMLAAAIWEEEK